MKIFFIFLFSAMLLPQLSNAQLALGGEDKGFMFGFNVGENAPLGGYGSSSQSNLPLGGLSKSDTSRMSGYAAGIHSSFHYDFYAGYKFLPHFGIMIEYNEDFNKYNIQTLNAQYQALLAPEQSSITSGDNFNITQFLAGPYFCLPLSDKSSNIADGKNNSFHLNPFRNNLSVEVKFLAGITSANYPTLSYDGTGETTLCSFGEGKGFGYFGSAGLKYDIVDGIGIHLDVNYEGSTITYPNYSVISYNNPNTMPPVSYTVSVYNSPKTMSIGLLQITLGFSLEF